MLCYRNLKHCRNATSPLKLSREVVVCIEGMAFIFITYSFYFIYFYFILLLQKIITSLQKTGENKVPLPPLPPPPRAPPAMPGLYFQCFSETYMRKYSTE